MPSTCRPTLFPTVIPTLRSNVITRAVIKITDCEFDNNNGADSVISMGLIGNNYINNSSDYDATTMDFNITLHKESPLNR